MSHYRKKHIKPHIQRLKKKKRLIKRPLLWICILLFLSATAFIYFFLFYPKLQIKHIEISGNEKINKTDIEILASAYTVKNLTIGPFTTTTQSIFFIDTQQLSKNILERFSRAEDVEVQRKFPDTIYIHIKERNPFAVVCQSENECFFVDSKGVIFERCNSIPPGMLIIESSSSNDIPKNIMDAISSIQKNLKDNFQIDTLKVTIADTLVVKTSEGWKIYFDSSADIMMQIKKMDILLKDQISPALRKNLQYIYLQYKDRAYYK